MECFLDLGPPLGDPDRARWWIIPVPYDGGASWRPGARDGPRALLEASAELEAFDEETHTDASRSGIHTAAPVRPLLSPEETSGLVEQAVDAALRAGKIPVVLGGDHSVSIGAVRAAARLGRLNLLHLDAHADLRDSYQGSRYSHACVMRRLWDVGRPVQVGLRSLSEEEFEFLKAEGREPVWSRDFKEDPEGARKRALSLLDPKLPTWITLDLDVLDPSVMPSVGTPEPGGLGWYELLSLLRGVVERTRIVGFDVVELCPIPGLRAPDFLAARLAYKIMNYQLAERGL